MFTKREGVKAETRGGKQAEEELDLSLGEVTPVAIDEQTRQAMLSDKAKGALKDAMRFMRKWGITDSSVMSKRSREFLNRQFPHIFPLEGNSSVGTVEDTIQKCREENFSTQDIVEDIGKNPFYLGLALDNFFKEIGLELNESKKEEYKEKLLSFYNKCAVIIDKANKLGKTELDQKFVDFYNNNKNKLKIKTIWEGKETKVKTEDGRTKTARISGFNSDGHTYPTLLHLVDLLRRARSKIEEKTRERVPERVQKILSSAWEEMNPQKQDAVLSELRKYLDPEEGGKGSVALEVGDSQFTLGDSFRVVRDRIEAVEKNVEGTLGELAVDTELVKRLLEQRWFSEDQRFEIEKVVQEGESVSVWQFLKLLKHLIWGMNREYGAATSEKEVQKIEGRRGVLERIYKAVLEEAGKGIENKKKNEGPAGMIQLTPLEKDMQVVGGKGRKYLGWKKNPAYPKHVGAIKNEKEWRKWEAELESIKKFAPSDEVSDIVAKTLEKVENMKEEAGKFALIHSVLSDLGLVPRKGKRSELWEDLFRNPHHQRIEKTQKTAEQESTEQEPEGAKIGFVTNDGKKAKIWVARDREGNLCITGADGVHKRGGKMTIPTDPSELNKTRFGKEVMRYVESWSVQLEHLLNELKSHQNPERARNIRKQIAKMIGEENPDADVVEQVVGILEKLEDDVSGVFPVISEDDSSSGSGGGSKEGKDKGKKSGENTAEKNLEKKKRDNEGQPQQYGRRPKRKK